MSSYTPAEAIDPSDELAHPVGMAVGSAIREGLKGSILGLPIGYGVSKLTGRGSGSRIKDMLISSAIGTGVGMINGVSKANHEREALMGKYASQDVAFEAGRAYAHDLIKSAFSKDVNKGLGYALTGTAAGAGKVLQALGHVGYEAEHVARKINPEVAGQVLSSAGLMGVGAYGAIQGPDIAAAALGAAGGNTRQQQNPFAYQTNF